MIAVRASAPEDAAAVAACVDVVARERRWLASVEGFSVAETRTFIESLLAAGGVQIIAVQDDLVVGWCDIVPLAFEGMHHVGSLGLGVLPAHRRGGLGTRLLREAVRAAFAKDLLRIELRVFASNEPAIHLYEREGFVTEGRKRRARILDGVEDDILEMGLLKSV
jgi:RimJ/RimL family protein N-acetyltransferase